LHPLKQYSAIKQGNYGAFLNLGTSAEGLYAGYHETLIKHVLSEAGYGPQVKKMNVP
jgi:hypothetical protein